MKNEGDMRTYTAAELEARRTKGESRTNLAQVRAKSQAELERDIAADPDFRNIPDDWHELAVAIMPNNKKLLSIRLDEEIIDWFKRQGPGYQTRMNAVLRAFVRHNGGAPGIAPGLD